MLNILRAVKMYPEFIAGSFMDGASNQTFISFMLNRNLRISASELKDWNLE